jgi:hypothetical protein
MMHPLYSYLSLLSFVLLNVGAFHLGHLVPPVTKWRIPVRNVAALPTRSSCFKGVLTLRSAHSLQTSLEFLADERSMRGDAAYKGLHWFDPTQSIDLHGIDDYPCLTLPLYPLSATYLPAMGVNHTLNNVQPKNICMALDLAATTAATASATASASVSTTDGRFCVALNTIDTGKIATVGVIMRVLQIEPQERDGTVVRVRVTCRCEDIVKILRVENPDAASLENRIRRSDDYLMARVQPHHSGSSSPVSLESSSTTATTSSTTNREDGGDSGITQKLVDDYNAVRQMYLDGTGKNDLPPFALATLTTDLPALSLSSSSSTSLLTDSALFWQTAQMWQTLCYTVREGRQMRLSVDRNEIMIAAAMKKGGPLKLPVHVEDLGPVDRRQLEEMEVEAQREWVALGMDPCLDFQVLLTLEEAADRVAFLGRIIHRERLRLEEVARQPALTVEKKTEPEPQRKGAWFDDDW